MWIDVERNREGKKGNREGATNTLPKMVFFRSSQSARSKVRKNWEALELGVPALAEASRPRWLKRKREWNSSGKTEP